MVAGTDAGQRGHKDVASRRLAVFLVMVGVIIPFRRDAPPWDHFVECHHGLGRSRATDGNEAGPEPAVARVDVQCRQKLFADVVEAYSLHRAR